jgi:hypothetical protein
MTAVQSSVPISRTTWNSARKNGTIGLGRDDVKFSLAIAECCPARARTRLTEIRKKRTNFNHEFILLINHVSPYISLTNSTNDLVGRPDSPLDR